MGLCRGYRGQTSVCDFNCQLTAVQKYSILIPKAEVRALDRTTHIYTEISLSLKTIRKQRVFPEPHHEIRTLWGKTPHISNAPNFCHTFI